MPDSKSGNTKSPVAEPACRFVTCELQYEIIGRGDRESLKVRQTIEFVDWLNHLRDRRGRARILARIQRLEEGNPGQTRGVGSGVFEMKIDVGPGYRVYCTQRGQVLVVLLCGGDKSTQEKDIQRAKVLAAQWEEGL
jgi:putative addiction module killer protein